MLYKLRLDNTPMKLEPLPFLDMGGLQRLERNLEELLSSHLLDILFEDATLIPIFRERRFQPEADLYALNRQGDLVIFELKRGLAGADAMLQALRYAQEAGQWTFDHIEKKYRTYCQDKDASLISAHKGAFGLERPLTHSEFNTAQHLLIVGNAANDELIRAVEYWKNRGLSVDFLPYRIYDIGGESYFEFFALPYDRHQNPSSRKYVIFDTNRSYDENAVWEMMSKSRVAAYGDQKYVVDRLNTRDMVFFWHSGCGLIAAGEVVSPSRDDGPDQRFRDVRFLTHKPDKKTGITESIPASDVVSITGNTFFWARIIKVPYLTKEQACNLLEDLNRRLAAQV